MKTTHTIITANYDVSERAKNACIKHGLNYEYDYKYTCVKKHHITITATTPVQDYILHLIILASTAHPEQDKYIKKLLTL